MARVCAGLGSDRFEVAQWAAILCCPALPYRRTVCGGASRLAAHCAIGVVGLGALLAAGFAVFQQPIANCLGFGLLIALFLHPLRISFTAATNWLSALRAMLLASRWPHAGAGLQLIN